VKTDWTKSCAFKLDRPSECGAPACVGFVITMTGPRSQSDQLLAFCACSEHAGVLPSLYASGEDKLIELFKLTVGWENHVKAHFDHFREYPNHCEVGIIEIQSREFQDRRKLRDALAFSRNGARETSAIEMPTTTVKG